MDAINEGQAARKKFVTGTLIFIVAASFIIFLTVIVRFWITQPEPSAILDIEADPFYDQAKIVIEAPDRSEMKKTIDIATQSKYRFILNPGVINIKIFRDESVFYQDAIDIHSGQSLLTLKPPGSAVAH